MWHDEFLKGMGKWVDLPQFLSQDDIHLITLTEIISLILFYWDLEQEYTYALGVYSRWNF